MYLKKIATELTSPILKIIHFLIATSGLTIIAIFAIDVILHVKTNVFVISQLTFLIYQSILLSIQSKLE